MFEEIELKFLSSEEQTELRKFEKLFESPEWEHIEKELEEQISKEKERVILATTWEDNRVCTGRLLAYHGVKSYPSAVLGRFQSIAAEAEITVLDEFRDDELAAE